MSDPRDNHSVVISTRVDCGAASFLPICVRCPWRGLPRGTRAAAAAVADRHAWTQHADAAALNATMQRRRREAVPA